MYFTYELTPPPLMHWCKYIYAEIDISCILEFISTIVWVHNHNNFVNALTTPPPEKSCLYCGCRLHIDWHHIDWHRSEVSVFTSASCTAHPSVQCLMWILLGIHFYVNNMTSRWASIDFNSPGPTQSPRSIYWVLKSSDEAGPVWLWHARGFE